MSNSNVATNSISILNLTQIGANISYTSVFPMVDLNATPNAETKRGNLQIIGNVILSGAGGYNFPPAAQSVLAQTVSNAAQPNITSFGNVSNLTMVAIGALKIPGGSNGFFIQTDGAGNLAWAAGGGNGNGSPGGSNTQVQFNDAGTFGGNYAFTFNKTSSTVYINNITTAGNANLGSPGNVRITGGLSGYFLSTDGMGNLSWAASNGVTGPGGLNTYVQFNNAGTFAGSNVFTYNSGTNLLSVPNIIATGNIVSSNLSAGYIQTSGNIVGGNITATGNLAVRGNVNLSIAPNINLGPISNVTISGGLNGSVLQTDGLGNLSWGAGGGGGNGVPGGTNTQVQFNNNGSFGGSPYFVYDDYHNILTVSGNLVANSLQLGAGSYAFCSSDVYFASTSSTGSNQLLFSVPVANIIGVEFNIFATNSIVGSAQSEKIVSIVYQGTVQFNDFAGLQINGGCGTFSVNYNAGNILIPQSLQLLVTPESSSQTVYKMLITTYNM